MAIQQIKLGGKSIVPDCFSVLSTASGSTTTPSSAADIRSSTTPIININGSGHIYHLYVPFSSILNIEIDGKLVVKEYTESLPSHIININSFLYRPMGEANHLYTYVPANRYTSKDRYEYIDIDTSSVKATILSNYAKGEETGSLNKTVLSFDELFYSNNIKIYVYTYMGTSQYVVMGTICKEI